MEKSSKETTINMRKEIKEKDVKQNIGKKHKRGEKEERNRVR